MKVALRHQRPLLEAVMDLVEANRNGARVVLDLRSEQKRLQTLMEAELEKEFSDLGHWVAMVVEGQGGLFSESTDEPADNSRVLNILRRANLSQWAKEHLAPIFEKQWRRVLDSTALTLNRNQVPVQVNNAMAQRLLRMGEQRIGLLDIEEDTRRALLDIVKLAREAGLDTRTTAKAIEDRVPAGRFVNAGSRYRSQLIARTETLNAQRYSSLELYRESPAVREVECYDGDGDELCAARNGEVMPLEEAEGELNNTHPNCVLCFGPVV